uniref:NADH dehydrogenase subunit 6 n=1 Tax=Typosyllis antoni TaxID=1898412 RepID=A0A1C9UZD2_9ANNE|nr:NADH dehydrogenase subunit 6 [Typosyllis antoni]AOR87149.1 NADH dehydrogenase subunit 6 [Typosyllis antoni]
MLKILPFIILSMSMTLSMIPNPLPLGMYILSMSLIMTMLMCLTTSSWMAMSVFLIYIGGLLILFSYFLSIQPNQFTTISTFTLTSLILLLMFKASTTKFYLPQMMSFNSHTLSIPFMMFSKNLPFIIIITSILLMILIVVVKITISKSGPLRPFS